MSEIVVVYALVAFHNNQTLGHTNGKETNATFFRQVFLVNCDWLSAAEDCALPNHSMKISYLSLYANMKSNDLLFLLLTFFPTLEAFNAPSFFWTTVTIYYWYFLFKFHSFTLKQLTLQHQSLAWVDFISSPPVLSVLLNLSHLLFAVIGLKTHKDT